MLTLQVYWNGLACAVVNENGLSLNFYQDEQAQWLQDRLDAADTEEEYQDILAHASDVIDEEHLKRGGYIEE